MCSIGNPVSDQLIQTESVKDGEGTEKLVLGEKTGRPWFV